MIVASRVLSLFLAGSPADPGPAVAQVATTVAPQEFCGAWDTDEGLLVLELGGDGVRGEYAGGTLEGAVRDGRLEYRYRDSSGSGTGWFELAENGTTLRGKWRSDDSPREHSWNGMRLPSRPAPGPFDGLWNTSYGPLRLFQDSGEDVVRGLYQKGLATLEGRVNAAGRLEFSYREPDAAGQGWFERAGDGERLRGEWHPEGDSRWRSWTAERQAAAAGIAWLVILEANWEESLAEPEYAFGEMLQNYFEMAPARHVRVRRRFFHDADDLRRLCHEVPFLAEPVVLLISTHGSPRGVEVSGETIGAEELAAALSPCGNLRLLHLSGCDMMRGNLPRRLLESLPPERRFPVSGYTTTVDWDASALGDFLFLSLLLIRGYSPARAVEESHRLAPFTAAEPLEDSPFAALGLAILLPQDLAAR